MSVKNKMCVLSAFLLCVFLFAGCSLRPDGNASVKETTDTEKIKGAELSALQSEIIGSNSAVGIAFVDYVEDGLSEGDVAGYLINSELAKKYPFLKGIKTVAYNGLELFVLVPASDNGVITVYPNTINDKGELEANRDVVIFKGKKGEAVALRCNINESYPNVLVSVTQGDAFLEFYPTISLRDGWSVALQDGCYDFSLDDIRKYTSEAYDMEDRDWYIFTCGYATTAFTAAGIEYIGNEIKPDLSDGSYADAFTGYAELCDDFITHANSGEPYDEGKLPRKPLSLIWIPVSLLIGFLIAKIVVGNMKSKLKTVHAQATADSYVKSGSMNITESRDLFLYHTVTRTERPKNNSSSGGSNGGSSHGGGGGKF